MKILNKSILFSLLSVLTFFIGCNKEDEASIIVSRSEFNFPAEGDTLTLVLQTDADEWRIQNPADWISLSPTNGTDPSTTIEIIVSSKTPETRSETLTVFAGSADPVEITVTQSASEFLYELSSNFSAITFKKGGNTNVVTIKTDAPEFQITSDADWLSFDPQTSSEDSVGVSITASENVSDDERTATITISAAFTPTYEITASQIGMYYPDYNTDPLPPDETGMTSTAVELAGKMTLGINIGNTLEAIGGETAWGNPLVNAAYVNSVKELGFDAIRIPCSFNQYANPKTAKISDEWLDRVKDVVELCVNNDLYTVINIHWDGGWLENNVTPGAAEEVNARQKAFWEQIATHLRDFDEHLIFAGTNEPNVDNATQMAVLDGYLQTFVDAVRSTGGKNSYRVLVFQGASTDIEKTDDLLKNIPTDEVPNKLMAELHYYTPYQFCLMQEDADWGNVFYYWGQGFHSTENPDRNATWGEEDDMNDLFGITHSQFVQKGIPVVLGEFGAYKRPGVPEKDLHDASVEYFNGYVVKECQENGFIPFYWDTGGAINRSSGAVQDQGLIDAMLEGAGN